MHILSLVSVTDINPSWISWREENGHRIFLYIFINLHECMGPCQDRTQDPLICSQTIAQQPLCVPAELLLHWWRPYCAAMITPLHSYYNAEPLHLFWACSKCALPFGVLCDLTASKGDATAFCVWAVTCDFQQCGILTSVDSDEHVQPPFKCRNCKWCSVSSITVIAYSSD